jgi:hypothetical protein
VGLVPIIGLWALLLGPSCASVPKGAGPERDCSVPLSEPTSTEDFAEHVDDGWAICYPNRMTLTEFVREGENAVALGIGIANFDAELRTWDGYWQMLRTFPADGTLLTFGWGAAASGCGGDPFGRPDSTFPLDLSDLAPDERKGGGGSEPRPVGEVVIANGISYSLRVWVGPEASPDDRRAMGAIVGSLRFFPLRPGDVLQPTSCEVYYVLDRPDHYPVGSVTEFDAREVAPGSGKQFFLVHVQEGFYTLTWDDTGPWDDSGEFRRCDIAFYPESEQFVCRDGGNRYTLRGDLVGGSDGPDVDSEGTPMEPHSLHVRVALDGHLLVLQNAWHGGVEEPITHTSPDG